MLVGWMWLLVVDVRVMYTIYVSSLKKQVVTNNLRGSGSQSRRSGGVLFLGHSGQAARRWVKRWLQTDGGLS